MAGGTAVVVDRRMLAHDPGWGHPERPERLRVLLDHLEDARDVVHLGARAADADELALVHPPAHVERVAATAGRPRVAFDADTSTSPASWEAARLAAGSLLVVCEAVLAGQVDNGFALVRPPGHHAERERAMGFCLFNNVATAAAWLRRRGIGRVAIIDWDLHHGNGTQHLFEEDPDVLYVSTHQFPFYPGTGRADEVGRGPGAGRTLNLPFPAGFGDAEYVRAFDEIVAPIVRQFAPEFVLVSAGFDADARDPLGGMEVTPAGFSAMALQCVRLAHETARGRIAAVLEGGYDLDGIVEGVDATLKALRGEHAAPRPATGAAERADQVLARVRAAQSRYWQV
jgi:acetoin utilization deacetylase AcuC-like enzyme